MQEVSRRVKALGEELDGRRGRAGDRRWRRCPTRPTRAAADEDTTLREVGDATKAGADHLELAGALIDMEAGARVAGSRFAVPQAATSCCSSWRWCAGRWRCCASHGFEPVVPPVLVREEALFGTGFLPDTEQQIYRLADDALYLAGT